MKTFLKIASFSVFVFLLTSCSNKSSNIQSFRYFENARQKPVVALVPLVVKDRNEKISWDLSTEFTAEIQKRIINRSEIYLNPVRLSEPLKDKLQKQDLVTLKKEDLKELKAQNQFAIFMELMEHKELTYQEMQGEVDDELNFGDEDVPKYLVVKVRLRVYDLREDQPKVLLQEILTQKHIIPYVERQLDYHKVVWGGDSYKASLYGRVHAKVEKEIVQHVENYISIAK